MAAALEKCGPYSALIEHRYSHRSFKGQQRGTRR